MGNSATQLYTKLCEGHSEAWMRRTMQYLGECKHFLALGTGRRQFPPPPPMPPVPTPVWLLTVYSYDVLSRLDEVKARVTSIFGSVLKMDSTKKVTCELTRHCHLKVRHFIRLSLSLPPGDQEACRYRRKYGRLGHQRCRRARPGPQQRADKR